MDSPTIPLNLSHKRAVEEEVTATDFEAAVPRVWVEDLPLEVMLERTQILESLMIGMTLETTIHGCENESNETLARKILARDSLSTACLSGTLDIDSASFRPFLGHEQKGHGHESAAAPEGSINAETRLNRMDSSFMTWDRASGIHRDTAEDDNGGKPGSQCPHIAITEDQTRGGTEHYAVPLKDRQPGSPHLAQQKGHSAESEPIQTLECVEDERQSEEVVQDSHARGESSCLLVGNGKQDCRPIVVHSEAVDRFALGTNEGHVECARGTVSVVQGVRRKQPSTKRKRVVRSQDAASMPVKLATPVEREEEASALSGNFIVCPLLAVAGPSQIGDWNPAGKIVRQRPTSNMEDEYAPESITLVLLQKSLNEARAQASGEQGAHGLLTQRSGNKPCNKTVSSSQVYQDKKMGKSRGDLEQDVKVSPTQTKGNMTKSKRRKTKARTTFSNRRENGLDDAGINQAASRSKAKKGLDRSNRHGHDPVGELPEGLEAIAKSPADVRNLCAGNGSEEKVRVREAGKIGSAVENPQCPSTLSAKKHRPRKRQYTQRVNKNDNLQCEDIHTKCGSSDDPIGGDNEGVLARSDLRRESSPSSPFNSPQHKQPQLSSIINNPSNSKPPRFNHKIAATNNTTATATPAQLSQRRRRAKNKGTHRRQLGAEGNMNTPRGTIPGARGRSHPRSSNQDENVPPSLWPSRAPSIASNSTTRRPRGFQPAEVGRSKSSIEAGVTSLAPPKAHAVTQFQESAAIQQSESDTKIEVTPPAAPNVEDMTNFRRPVLGPPLPHMEPSIETQTNGVSSFAASQGLTDAFLAQTPQQQNQVLEDLVKELQKSVKSNPSDPSIPPSHEHKMAHSTNPVTQSAINGAAKPDFDSVQVHSGGEHVSSETSSIQIITNDEPQRSCWSRAVITETAPPSLTPNSEWDNSANPIDNPLLMSKLLPPDYRGPVAADLRNLPKYKFPGSKRTGTTAFSKQAEEASASNSFQRQIALIQQNTQSPQAAPTPQPPIPASMKAVDRIIPTVVLPEKSSVQPTVGKESVKLPPHLRAKGASASLSTKNTSQSSMAEIDRRPRHLRQSVGHTRANNEGKDPEDGNVTNTSSPDTTPTPPQHGETTKLGLPKPDSLEDVTPGTRTADISSSVINVDEEVAAAQRALDTENDAQIAATIAAESSHLDEQIAAVLQAQYTEDAVNSNQPQNVAFEEERPQIPPHLKISKGMQKATKVDAKLQNQSSATRRRDHDRATAPYSRALKDVTNLRQNGTMSSPLGDAAHANGNESVVKKGKRPVYEDDHSNDVSHLVGWDGKMVPAPLGEDWDLRKQHDPQSHEKLAVIKTWTEDHAVDSEGEAAKLEEKLMSPIRIKHPITKPNPDEFNQAKRHLNTDDHIQAYKAKHPASVDDSTPSDRGRISREEKREGKRRQLEEEKTRVYPPNEHAPAANIYLRPAEFKDMRHVSFLHNHYVLKTPFAHELDEQNELLWRDRISEVKAEGDPFLVAVHMGSKPVNSYRDVHRKKSETIVGFAYALDYGLQTSAYRFTVELEIWVHPEHVRQGIGRSMLDRMLAALDPGYNLLECAPFLGNDEQSRWIGGSHCLVKTIVVNLLHNEDTKKDVDWKKDWLTNKNNFVHTGNQPGIGHKFGKGLDNAQLMMRTSASISLHQ